MPKATLTFNLPEEQEEFEITQNGIRYKIVLDELDNYLRNKLKYTELSKEEEQAFRLIRQHLNDLLLENTKNL